MFEMLASRISSQENKRRLNGNSVDPDQVASTQFIGSGSTMFAKDGNGHLENDNVCNSDEFCKEFCSQRNPMANSISDNNSRQGDPLPAVQKTSSDGTDDTKQLKFDPQSTPVQRKRHKIHPPTVDVPLGFTEFADKEKDATLICTFNNGFDATSKWYKDGREVRTWQAKQTFDGRTAKLVFREATESICGVYECIVKNTHGEAKTRGWVSLFVRPKPPKPSKPLKPHILIVPPPEDVPLGLTEFADKEKDATLICKFNKPAAAKPLTIPALPPPYGFGATSKWYKDGREVRTWQAKQTFDGRTAKLVFREATESICGVYECIVKNTHGEAKTRGWVCLLDLSVFLPPTVDVPLEDTEFADKQKDATLICKFNRPGTKGSVEPFSDSVDDLKKTLSGPGTKGSVEPFSDSVDDLKKTLSGPGTKGSVEPFSDSVDDLKKTLSGPGTKGSVEPFSDSVDDLKKTQSGKDAEDELTYSRSRYSIFVGAADQPFRLLDEQLKMSLKPMDVSRYLKKAEKSSTEVQCFLELLKSIVEKSLKDVLRLMIRYKQPYNNMPIFVAIVHKHSTDFPTQVMGFTIIQRVKGHVSDEARVVTREEREQKLSFTAREQSLLFKCLAKNSDNLMKEHSNLMIVSASSIKSTNHGKPTASYRRMTCIVLYVDVKGVIPMGEEEFPTRLDGFSVDVREGNFIQYTKNPGDYHEHLMMGCQIVTDYSMSGTLGGFVQLTSGKIACITCCHLFETPKYLNDFHKDKLIREYLRKDVYQPTLEQKFKIGEIHDFIREPGDNANIGVDAALIEITSLSRYPKSGCFPNAEFNIAGYSAEIPMLYNTGEVVKGFEEIGGSPYTVVKYGAETGHTKGALHMIGSAVRTYSTSFCSEDNIQLHQQLEVISDEDHQFARLGDSGALVFSKSENGAKLRALGLLVGGTTHGTTIVTPIWAVLNKFRLPLRLLDFPLELEHRLRIAQRNEKLGKDVEDLKNNAIIVNQQINLIGNKIDQLSLQSQITDQKIDAKFTEMLDCLKQRR